MAAAPGFAMVSDDGCPISAYDEGSGPVTVIIVHGGLDDGRGYVRLAGQLTNTHRVLRLVRRQYRTDAEQWRPVDMTDEAADVVAGRPQTGSNPASDACPTSR